MRPRNNLSSHDEIRPARELLEHAIRRSASGRYRRDADRGYASGERRFIEPKPAALPTPQGLLLMPEAVEKRAMEPLERPVDGLARMA